MRKLVLLLVPFLCGMLNASPLKLPRLATGINTNGCLEVFFIDADNKLYHKWQTIRGEKWAEHEVITDSVKGIFMGSNASGALEVFYIDLENRLYNFRQNTPGLEWTKKKSLLLI